MGNRTAHLKSLLYNNIIMMYVLYLCRMIDDSTHYDSTITTNPQLLTSPQHSHITLTSKASPGHTDGLPASPAKVTC